MPYSPLRPSAAVLYRFGFGRITTLGLGARIKTLPDHMVDAAFAAVGREVAFDRMSLGALTGFERLDAAAVGDGRSFLGGFRVGGDEEHHDHNQTCEQRFDGGGCGHA